MTAPNNIVYVIQLGISITPVILQIRIEHFRTGTTEREDSSEERKRKLPSDYNAGSDTECYVNRSA